jgi:hypothetical protein
LDITDHSLVSARSSDEDPEVPFFSTANRGLLICIKNRCPTENIGEFRKGRESHEKIGYFDRCCWIVVWTSFVAEMGTNERSHPFFRQR